MQAHDAYHGGKKLMFDPIHYVKEIIRDAVVAGEIDEDPGTFDDACERLKGNALEDYLQEVWDRVEV